MSRPRYSNAQLQLLNRRPPFGLEVQDSIREFPYYSLQISELDVRMNGGVGPVEINLSIKCGLVEEQMTPRKQKKQKTRGMNMTVVLTLTSDMDFVDFRRISSVIPSIAVCASG